MSKLEVDAIEPQSGTTLTLGASGDTITIPSGATLSNSGTATGFGKVLQVVQNRLTTLLSTTSGTFVEATGFNVSITPSSASSKILVMVSTCVQNTGADVGTYVTLARNSTVLEANGLMFHKQASGESYFFASTAAFNYLDTPSTTSAITYKVYIYSSSAGGTAQVNYDNNVGTITAIEIGA